MVDTKNQTSDVELVLHITGYNVTAFEQLYERYSPIIYPLVKKIIRDNKLAQSVLLNVFAVFLKRIEFYDTGNDNVFTWLMLLSRNISLDTLKRLKSGNDILKTDDNYEIEVILPKLSSVINPIVYDESTEKIKSYKNHLTEVQNLVLSLAYFEGLNEEEISKRLNLPVATIREKILNIMGSLMQLLYGVKENHFGRSKDIIDLIKLDVLGCLSEEEKKQFNSLKQNNQDFLWKELGEYQNLTALLATSLPAENPPAELTEKIDQIFGSVLQGNEADYAINIESVKPKAPEADPNILPEVPAKETTIENKISPDVPFKNPIVENRVPPDVSSKEPIKEHKTFPEIHKENKQEFSIKFREPDPNPLFILKKQEAINKSPDSISPLTKEKEKIEIAGQKTKTQTSISQTDIKNTQPALAKDEKFLRPQTIQPNPDKLNLNAKTNEPVTLKKETLKDTVKEETVLQSKTIQPIHDKSNPIAKTNEAATIKKEMPSVPVKEAANLHSGTIQPTADRLNTKIKVNEPVTVKLASVKEEKISQPQTIQPTSDRLSTAAKKDEPVFIKKETQQVPVKNEKDLQEKKIQSTVVDNDVKTKISEQVHISKNKEVAIEKNKINESAKASETKTSKGKTNPAIKAKESINVDEIISRIEDDDMGGVFDEKSLTGIDEVSKLKKKLRRNYFITAALLVFLITAGAIFYFKFNGTSNNVADKNTDLLKSEISLPDISNAPQVENVLTEQNTVINEEQIAEPVETQSTQTMQTKVEKTDTALPLVKAAGNTENNIVSDLKTNNDLSANNNVEQTKENKIVVEEKKLVTAPVSAVKKTKEETAFLVAAEEQPQLVGGLKGIQSKITYPEIARKNGIEGKVIVQAVVDENGKVISAKTLKGIGGGCDEVAIEAVKESRFLPGKQGGKPVKVQVSIPIVFKR